MNPRRRRINRLTRKRRKGPAPKEALRQHAAFIAWMRNLEGN